MISLFTTAVCQKKPTHNHVKFTVRANFHMTGRVECIALIEVDLRCRTCYCSVPVLLWLFEYHFLTTA